MLERMAGYSKTPLVKKLGIVDGARVVVKGAPRPYAQIVDGLPASARVTERFGRGVDLVHLFVTERAVLARLLPKAAASIAPGGAIWVSWPKRSAGVPSDMTEDVVRAVCLPMDLVDVKVCAVDEVWSGLAFVRRLADR